MPFVYWLSAQQITKDVYAKHRYAAAHIYAAYLRKGKPINIYTCMRQTLKQIFKKTLQQKQYSTPFGVGVIH
jgi:adenosine/AMP kinase